ncbi:MAG: recombinase family protein [Chloroflexi bacterium]|nr:recombinase family protein [Chloroflexota bacterium]
MRPALWEGRGVRFISITQPIDTSGPMGRFMLNVLGAVAELEREFIRERVVEGMNRARREGKRLGQDAYHRVPVLSRLRPALRRSPFPPVRPPCRGTARGPIQDRGAGQAREHLSAESNPAIATPERELPDGARIASNGKPRRHLRARDATRNEVFVGPFRS